MYKKIEIDSHHKEVIRMQETVEQYDIELDQMKKYPMFPRITGIYFLFLDEELVYIGKSKDIFYRMSYHVRDKNFNHFAIIECPAWALDYLEAHFFTKFFPKLNSCLPNNPLYRRSISLGVALGLRPDQFINLVSRNGITPYFKGTNIYSIPEIIDALGKNNDGDNNEHK